MMEQSDRQALRTPRDRDYVRRKCLRCRHRYIEQDQIERGFSRGENPWVFDLLQGLRGHFRIKAMAPDLGEHEGAIPSFRNALRIGLVRGSGPEFDRCIGATGLDAILSRALK